MSPRGRPGSQAQQRFDARPVGGDVALFVIDARAGLTPLDEEIARWLRGHATPVVVAANKAEGRQGEAGVLEAYALGMVDPIALSA